MVYVLAKHEHHLAGYFIGWDIRCILMKVWAKPVLIVLGACLCLAFVALIVGYKGEVTARGRSPASANICDVPQALSKEDHKFLDDLFPQQTRQSDPVPRAELIVNTSEVRRAQLVVNRRVVERGELVRSRR
jgi:hypothetical protein